MTTRSFWEYVNQLMSSAPESAPEPTPSLDISRVSGSRDVTVRHVNSDDWRSFAMRLAFSTLSSLLLYFVMKKLMGSILDPNRKSSEAARKVKMRVIKRIQQRQKQNGVKKSSITQLLNLSSTNSHEDALMSEIIFPEQIDVDFNSIGGLTKHKKQIQRTVLAPFEQEDLIDNSLLRHPKGVLFFGPPGTGKSMMAKAIAKSSNATFINLRASVIQDKWYGESVKIVSAVFTLAQKLSPSIIFIDECDSFLRQRGGGMNTDHEITTAIKTEFMAYWDGLLSESPLYDDDGNEIPRPKVMVLGATNRPQDLDEAVLRRFSRRFAFELPDEASRAMIFSKILSSTENNLNINHLASATPGYSGSDIKELCKLAVTMARDDEDEPTSVPSMSHFIDAMDYVRPTNIRKRK